jgi:hypothetical protein
MKDLLRTVLRGGGTPGKAHARVLRPSTRLPGTLFPGTDLRLSCGGRIRRGNKSTWREGFSASEASVKPDPKLSSNLKGRQGFGVGPIVLVGRLVADGTKMMKKVANFPRDDSVDLSRRRRSAWGS